MKIRITALLCAVCTLAAVFAGCQSSELREYTESPAPTDEAGEQAAAAETAVMDYTPVFETYDPDTVMMTVNGYDVTWRELFYWYYYDVTTLVSYFGEIPAWDEPSLFDSTVTYRDYVMNNAMNTIKHYRALESKAADAGVTLTEEDQANIDARWQASVDSYGGGDEAAFIEYLESVYLSEELYRYINEINALYSRLLEELYGANGEKLEEAEVIAEAEEQGYMRAKHILFGINDATTGEPLSEEEKAAKLADAEATLEELRALESDPAALEARMDELIAEKSDDPGSAYYPDGYTFLPNVMTAAFETGTSALEPGQLSDIVNSEQHGYHIIMRLELDPQALVTLSSDGASYTLAGVIAQQLFSDATTDWAEECEIVYSEEYEAMDIAELFGKVVTITTPAE